MSSPRSQEIAEGLQTALEQIALIRADLGGS